MANEYMHVIINLLLVLSVMFVLMFILKKVKLGKHAWNKHIKIINTISIGTKEKLMLVEVNKMFLLLGATPNHIETLYVFNELAEAVDELNEVGKGQKSFLEIFKRHSEGLP